jgi:hypothetical protein
MSTGRITRPEWTKQTRISGVSRACVFVVAVAFGVLAAPALARADPGSSTTQQLMQQAGAVMSSAQALASQQVAATSSAASAAMASTPASVPRSVAGVEKAATKAVSDAMATVGAASAGSALTPPPAALHRRVSRPAQHRHRHGNAARAHNGRARNLSSQGSGRAVGTASSVRAIGLPPPAAPRHSATHDHGSAARDRSAGAGPHRLPPVPAPPQGLSGSAEASGAGSWAPLLFAAFAAALFVILFELLSRLLPRSAFRKPRRLALPPWHPG